MPLIHSWYISTLYSITIIFLQKKNEEKLLYYKTKVEELAHVSGKIQITRKNSIKKFSFLKRKKGIDFSASGDAYIKEAIETFPSLDPRVFDLFSWVQL